MIACVLVSHLAVQVEQRRQVRLKSLPLVVVEDAGGRGTVMSMGERAAAGGVRVGQSLHRAAALYPQGQFVSDNPVLYRQAIQTLLVSVSAFSDRLEITDAGDFHTPQVYLDLGRLRTSTARTVAQKLRFNLRRDGGLSAQVGLASSKFVAAAAAQSTPTLRLIPRGEERSFLAPLPIALLDPDQETARLLRVLGIHNLGQFAALPKRAVLNQLGKVGVRLHELASGIDRQPVIPYSFRPSEYLEYNLDTAITDFLRLEHVFEKSASALARRLGEQHLVCGSLSLALTLEDHTTIAQTLKLSQPISTMSEIAGRLLMLVKRTRLHCGVVAIAIALNDLTPPVYRQLALFPDDATRQAEFVAAVRDVVSHFEVITPHTFAPAQPTSPLLEHRYRQVAS